jgi:hypothetical protein
MSTVKVAAIPLAVSLVAIAVVFRLSPLHDVVVGATKAAA